MRVSFMQHVDYYVGVPLCALFSVFNYVLRKLVPPGGNGDPKKILLIELSEMGSAIIAHSAIARIRSEFPGCEVYFLVFARNQEGVEILSAIPKENIIAVKDKNFLSFAFGLLGALFRIRRIGIDTAIDLELFSRCTALISLLSGARRRVGFYNGCSEGLYRGNFITHRVFYNHHQHMAANFMALVVALRANCEPPLLKINTLALVKPPPRLSISEAERTAAAERLKKVNPNLKTDKIVLLNPDPGLLALRGWPLDYYKELAARLVREDPEVAVVTVGLSRSRTVSAQIAAVLEPGRFADLCGETPDLRALLAVFSLSKVLVTNDSGPAHMASLSAMRCIVLFGPETPALYAPLGDNIRCLYANLACSPCYAASNHRRSICTNNRCLQAIPVDEALTAVKEALAG